MSTVHPVETLLPTPNRPNAKVRRSVLADRIERPKTDWGTLILVNLLSLLLHAVVLGICALIVFDRDVVEEIVTLLDIRGEPDAEPLFEQSLIQPDTLEPDRQFNESLVAESSRLIADVPALAELDVDDLEPSVVVEDFNNPGTNIKPGDHFSGRTAAAKAALLKKFGGSDESEKAVAAGLRWLASRQLKDGSWSFDHTASEACRDGGCSQAGSLQRCHNGATALALLAFLGGGHTHQTGEYQKVVKAGLEALGRNGRRSESGGLDFRDPSGEGNMFVHGLAAIALCETAAMTKDKQYANLASGAVKFITAAQDPKGGGWRYNPGDRGDTSVVGWQIMALKSAQNSKIKIPSTTFRLADKFLDSVQIDKGSRYRYMTDGRRGGDPTPSMTAVGLLCRMYMGWDLKNPHLKRGILVLDQARPSPHDIYYNYYATQVLHHWGGEEWKRWNNVMRDQLVRTQIQDGIEAGSWNVTDPHSGPGGRLYQTCLCIMTLEVYYRHLPIYRRDKVKMEF